MTPMLAILVLHSLALVGEAGAAEGERVDAAAVAPLPSLDGSLADCVVRAQATHPEVRAAFAEWEAAQNRIARAGALPEPTLSLSLYLSPVETRAGPQQARVGLQQAVPWPTQLTAGAEAASERAQAARLRLDALALAVAEQVEQAYWTLWTVRSTRALHADHLGVLEGLSASIRARIETGDASLADLQQVDLSRARLADRLLSMEAAERTARARLDAAIGEDSGATASLTEPPEVALPVESEADLVRRVEDHPELEAIGAMVRSAEATARAAASRRLPGFTVGGVWIPTGDGPGVDPALSGRDAVAASVGLRLPLWQGLYGRDVAAARAEGEAHRLVRESVAQDARAELTATLVAVEDSSRRVRLVRETLLPQAESAHGSVLGAVSSGRGSVAQALLSQQDLLELRVELAQARADHARAWASLRRLVGGEVASRPEGT